MKRQVCFLKPSFLFFSFLIMPIFSHASSMGAIEVNALHIVTDQHAGKSIISGDVSVKKDKDFLQTDELILYFNSKTHQPLKYEASGNVTFQITLEDGRQIKGKSKQATFFVDSDTYELDGDALVQEVGKSNQVRGDKISLSRKNGFVNIAGGGKKPAKVIFLYDESVSKLKDNKNLQKEQNQSLNNSKQSEEDNANNTNSQSTNN